MQHIDACVHPISTKLNSTLTQRATHVLVVHSYAVIRVIKGDLRYDRDCRHYSDRQRDIGIIQVILGLWADHATYTHIQGSSKGSPACTFYFISIIVNYFVYKCILLTENVSLHSNSMTRRQRCKWGMPDLQNGRICKGNKSGTVPSKF